MTIFLTALTILAGSAHALHQGAGADIYVRIDGATSIETLALAVRPIGKVESRTRGTSIYLIQLNEGVDDDQARERIGKVPGLHPLDPDNDPVDMQSVKSLDIKLADVKRDELRAKLEGQAKKVDHETEGVDYLKAYRYFVGQRAYPNDRVDWAPTRVLRSTSLK